jgi:hypothetical protein
MTLMRIAVLVLCGLIAAAGASGQTAPTDIAPSLPAPPASEDIQTLLLYARQALQAGHPDEAQEALERAETRALDRSVPAGTEREVATGPVVHAVGEARRALSAGNIAGAISIITAALPSAADADIPK